MQFGFILVFVTMLLWSVPVSATAIALASSQSCGPAVQDQGETQASVSLACTGITASATVNYLDTPPGPANILMTVSGTEAPFLAPMTATASFDVLVLVTGTDQAGFLRIAPLFSPQSTILITSHLIQGTQAQIMGMTSSLSTGILPFTIPYQPGVPLRLYGSLLGFSGARDIVQTATANFDGEFSVYISTTTDSDASNVTSPRVPGAMVSLVPEPSAFPILAFGAGLLALARVKARLTGECTHKALS